MRKRKTLWTLSGKFYAKRLAALKYLKTLKLPLTSVFLALEG